ncbi:MAG: FimB/Mfa2 family fimbrial subunit [Prevotellaceae bacterium]|nr:FimB/Mfa2 family fimbrial subunit [Prevotellaceae bacterium]
MIRLPIMRHALLLLSAVALLASCDLMRDDEGDCPDGLYVAFKYDYNLERTDLFKGHVGEVTLYVYDNSDRLVRSYTRRVEELTLPFAGSEYRTLHVTDLEPGRYRFTALAGQSPYSESMESGRARFVRAGTEPGSLRESLTVTLDHTPSTGGDGYDIVHNGLPLDTLWHGKNDAFVEVSAGKYTCDTLSLVRDTKRVHVALREIDDPSKMDIAHYAMTIVDRNATLLWNNEPEEKERVVYTPFAIWNTDDRVDGREPQAAPVTGIGRIGHADFMTSRILYHDRAADDALLIIDNLETGATVVVLDLPDILSRLRNSDDTCRYTPQAFLDRGYDYSIAVFLKGGRLDYLTVEIATLGWSKRIQYEEL